MRQEEAHSGIRLGNGGRGIVARAGSWQIGCVRSAEEQPRQPWRISLSLAHFSWRVLPVQRILDLHSLTNRGFSRMPEVSATIPKLVGDDKQSRRYFVSGLVQGVGFRFFAQREAKKLRVGGYARNLLDGRVEVLAIGSAAQLDEMKSALERGPQFSSVSGVREEAAHPDKQYEKGFVIEPDA
jgi:acylphosphatase